MKGLFLKIFSRRPQSNPVESQIYIPQFCNVNIFFLLLSSAVCRCTVHSHRSAVFCSSENNTAFVVVSDYLDCYLQPLSCWPSTLHAPTICGRCFLLYLHVWNLPQIVRDDVLVNDCEGFPKIMSVAKCCSHHVTVGIAGFSLASSRHAGCYAAPRCCQC